MKTARAFREAFDVMRIPVAERNTIGSGGTRPSLSSSLTSRSGSFLFQLMIDLVGEILDDRQTGRRQAPDDKGHNGSFEKRASLVFELWRSVLRQLVVCNRHQASEFVEQDHLARLATFC